MHRERSQPKAGNKKSNRSTGPTLPGTLYVVSSPIGDLDDITIRALRVLKTVSIIASEDPVSTQALLAHHQVINTVTSYGPRNLDEKVALLLDHLKKGHHVALVSDCGTPVIYDPGCRLIRDAHSEAIPVRSVPGPSALTAAIAISGYSGDSLLFEGHLPPPGYSLKTFLASLCNEQRTSVFFVSSYRIKSILLAVAKVLPSRQITIAQDLTKPRERIVQGTPNQVLKHVRRVQKGAEVAVVIEGRLSRSRPEKQPRFISST